jgi:hypothetical protein
MPQATEVAYPGWQAIGFRDRFAGYVCGIFLFDDHIRLIFEHGHLLPDRKRVLEGTTKQTRHITLHPGAFLQEDTIRDMVANALALGVELKAKHPV